MKHKYLRLLATVGILLGSGHVEAQYSSTAQLSAGNDTTLGCNVSCFTLHASLTEVKGTSSYLIDSTLSYSGNYGFTLTGATNIASVDEIYSGAVTLPFGFCFYGNTYTQLTIGTNGAINFGNTNAYQLNSGLFTSSIPSTEYPDATILAALQDLDITSGGSIHYKTIGSAPNRKFVINYYQVPQQGCTTQTTTMQVVLYETTNVIEIYIKDKQICTTQNGGATISGLQKDASTATALPGKNNTNWGGTSLNKAYRFIPNGTSSVSSVRLSNLTGTILATVSATGSGGQLSADFTNTCLTANTETYVVSATYYDCAGDSTVLRDTMTASKLVIPLPVPGGPIYYCQGATSAVPVSATGTALKWYTTLVGGTGSSTAPTPSTGTTGTFKYYVSQTISGCESLRDSVVVTVGAAGAGYVVSSNSPVCLNDTIRLHATTVPGASFVWTGPSSFLSYVQNPQMNSASYADSGTYSVTVTTPGCADFSGSTHVAITAGPFIGAVGIEHPTQCQGTDGKIKLYGLLNNTTYNTHLILNGSPLPTGSFTTNGSGMLTITGLTAGFYNSVTVSYAGCGSNEAGPVILNAVLAPTVTSSSTDPFGCGTLADGTITISGLLAYGDYTMNYEWNGVAQTSILLTANSGGDVTITNLEGGIYTNITATRLGCTTDPEGPISLAIPPTPVVTPTTNAPICGGDTIFLYGASTISTVTWAWTGPNSYTSTQQNPVRPNATTGYSGIYYLHATNTVTLCVSADSGIEVIVKPVPATPTATSNSPLCSGQTLNLSASGSGVGVTYNWSGPNSFTSTQQYPSISNVTTAEAGNYGVYASKDGCTSVGTATVSVTVTQTPHIDSTQYTDPTTCSGTNGTISLFGLAPSTTFSIGFDKNGTPQTPQSLTSNTSGVVVISTLSAGAYSNITASLNACASNIVGPLTLTDPANPATPTVTNNGPLCSGQTLNLTASSTTSGVTYSWTGPNSFSSSQQNPSLSNIQTTNAGTYSVVASINSCNSAAATTSVTVNQTPTTPVASSNSPICEGSTLTFTSSTVTGTYSWVGPNSFTSSSQNPSISNATTAATGNYIVNVSDNGCTSISDTVSVTVNVVPAISGTSYTDPTTCMGSNGTITLTGLVPGSVYTVNYSKNGTPQTPMSITANGSGNVIMTGLTAGAYSVINVTINACTSNDAATITLTDPAAPVISASNNSPICESDTLSLTVTTVTGASYSWSGPGSYTSSTQNPNILNATPANSGTYTVIATVNNCSDTATTTATVNATPTTPTITTNSPICSGDNLTFTTGTVSGGTYNWWGPNTFTSSIQSPSISNATTAATGTYSLSVSVNGCMSDTATSLATVHLTPHIDSLTYTDPTTCGGSNGTISLHGLANATTFTVNYKKNGSAQSGSITSNTSGIATITGLTQGYYDSVQVTANSCVSNFEGPVTLTDPSAPVITASNNSPICESDTLSLTVTPVTGASYSWSGPGSYTSTTQNPNILNATTANSGTYTVIATVNNCSDTATTTATVNATPTTPVITTNSPVCSGNNLTVNTTAVTGATYNWWGPNAFTSNTQNNTISNATTAASGIYNLTTTVDGCVSDTGTATVVVNATPTIASTSFTDPTICLGMDGTISLLGLNNNTTYTVDYTFNGTPQSAVTLTSNGIGTLTITGLGAGVYGTIFVTLNACASASVGTITLTDPAAPVISASNNTPICETDTVQLTVTTVTGATYTWSGPGSYSSTVQNPQIANATPTNNGTYTVIAMVNNCSDTATTVVTVNATPTTPTASSNSPVCSGDTLDLSAGTVSGATYNWWGPNAFTSTTQNPSINNVTTAAAGTYYVTATISGCASDTGSTVVVINATPHIDSATFTNPTMCAGNDGTITIYGLTASTTFTIDYEKNSTAQSQSVTTNGSGNGTITGLTAGTYTNFTATLNACASNILAGPVVLTDPSAPVITASNNTPICETDTVQLTVTTVTGATYTWSGPGSYSSTVQNPQIPNATPTNNGTYTVIATVNNCSDTATTVVTVNATPTTPTASSNSPVCTGDTLDLTAGTVSGATYNWWGPNSFTSTTQNPSINNVTTAAAGTYYVTATISGCASDTGSTVVVINATPHIDSATFTDPTMCAGSDGTITLYGLTASTTFTINYEKNSTAQSQSVTTNGSGNGTITGLTAGTYTNFTATLNACASNIIAGPVVLTDPSAPVITASNNTPICETDTVQLTVTTITGATYTWSGPGSYSSTVQNPQIPNATPTNNGTYTVIAMVNNCSDTATTVVTVNATPTTPTASSNSPVCSGDTLNLSAGTVSGATYNWWGPNSFTSTTQNPSINNVTTAAAGTYYVTATISGCASDTGSTVVVINVTPHIDSATFTNPTMCAGNDGTITIYGLTASTTFTIDYEKNSTAQSQSVTTNGSGNGTITGLTAGTYTNFTATLNACASNILAGPIVLTDPTAPAPPAAGSNSPLCPGDTLLLTASTTSGATYNWWGPNTFTSTQQNPVILNAQSVNAGTYYVTLTVNNCTSDTATTVVVVNPTPTTPTAGSNSPVCSGDDINLTSTTVTGATYYWTGPNAFTSTLQNPTVPNAQQINAGDYILSVSINSCMSAGDTVTVTVNETPVISDTAHTDPTMCGVSDGTITLMGLDTNIAYVVNYNFNNTAQTALNITSNGSGNVVMTGLGGGVYGAISVSLNGCTSDTVGQLTLIDPPPITVTASNNSPICAGDTIFLSATTVTGATYVWTGPNGYTVTTQNPFIAPTTVADSGYYTVTVTTSGCTSIDSTFVTIIATPQTPTAGSNSPVCEGSDINLTATTVGGASYSWTGPNSFTSNVQNPTINNAAMVNAGTYIVSVTGNGCLSGSDTVDVIVNPTPVITDTSHTDPTTCMGTDGTITLEGLNPGYIYDVAYQLSNTNVGPVVISADGSGNVIITGLGAGTYDSIFVSINGCMSNYVGPITLVDPMAPNTPDASNNTPICEGDTIELFGNTVPGVTYNWTGPNGYTSTQQNPVILNGSQADAGAYILTVSLNNCTSGADTTIVVVDTIPLPPTAGSNSPLCEGEDLNLTATLVSGATYNWTGPNSFTSNLQDPTITNAQQIHAGTYVVSVTSTSGCTSGTDSVDVIVNETPVISDTAHTDPTTCTGTDGTITLIGLDTNVSYVVNYLQNGTAQTATIVSDGSGNVVITGLPAGTYDTISVVLTPCASMWVGPIVLTDPGAPAMPTATNNTPICEGDTVFLFASTVPGVTYNWTGPNGFTSSLQNPDIPNATTADAGTYTVTASMNNCTSAGNSTLVVIDPTPTTPTPTSNSPLCSGDTLFLNATTVTGATYVWTGPNGFYSTIQNPFVANVTSADSGYYTIMANIGACSSGIDSILVIINTTPTTPTAGSNSPLCEGQTLNLTATTVNGATYNWGGPNGYTSSTQNPSIPGVTMNDSGVYYVSVSANGCTSGVDSVTVVIDSIPDMPVAGSNSPLCEGDTLYLTATTIAGATYNWTGPNGFTSNLQDPVVYNVTMADAGSYVVWITNGSACASPSDTVDVVINPATIVTGSASTNPTTCMGTDGTIVLYGFIPGNSYTITYIVNGTPVSVILVADGSGNITITGLAAGTYTNVQATNTNGCSSTGLANITLVDPNAPATPTAGSNSPVCEGSPINLTSTNTTGAVYNWTGPNSFTSSIQNPVIDPATSADAGTYYVSVTVNGCTSDVDSVTVVVLPTATPPVIVTNSPVCEGDPITFSVTTTGTTYLWWGPNGFSSTLQNPTITVSTLADAGTYYLVSTLNGCSSDTATAGVVVNPSPAITNTTYTDPTFCNGNDGTITMTGLDPGFTYLVDYTFNGVPQTPVSVVADGSGNVTITGLVAGIYTGLGMSVGACGDTVATTVTLVDPNAPASPVISNNGPLCEGDTLFLTASLVSGVTYSWSGPGGFTSALQNPDIPNVTAANAGTYTLTVYANGCNSVPVSTTVTINPTPTAPVASSNSPLCEGNTLTLFATTVGGATYTWTGPNNFTSSLQNPTILNALAINSGTYYVNANFGNCGSAIIPIVVTVTPIPNPPTVVSPVVYCEGEVATALGGIGQNLTWYTQQVGGSGSSFAPIPNTSVPGTTVYYVSQSINSCESDRDSIVVIVNPKPAMPVVLTPINYCQGEPAAPLTAQGQNLLWYSQYVGGTGSPSAPTPNTNNVATYVFYVTQTVNGCESDKDSIVVNILPGAQAPTVGGPAIYCQYGPALPALTSYVAGNNIVWYTQLVGGMGSTTPPVISTNTPGTFTYYVSQGNGSCESNRVAVSALVVGKPIPPLTNDVSYCQNAPVSSLSAQGQNIVWYDQQTGGTGTTTAPTPNTSIPGNTTYWVSQTVNGCESDRAPLTVVVVATPPAPVVTSLYTYCKDETTVQLTPNGGGYLWYTTSTGGTGSVVAPTPSSATPGTFNWWVTTNVEGCESDRAMVTVEIFAKPNAPITSPVNYCQGDPALPLTAQGQNLKWYSNHTGGTGVTLTPTPFTNTPGNVTYYVSQTVNGCESDRAPLVVTVYQNVQAALDKSKEKVCRKDTVTVMYTGTMVTGATYNWNFNSATVVSGVGPGPYVLTWNTSGSKVVTVTVTNGTCTDTETDTLTIVEAPDAVFTMQEDACIGEVIKIQPGYDELYQSEYFWNYGDAVVLSGSGGGYHTMKWKTPGLKTVTLVVQGEFCKSQPFVGTIKVHENPIAHIESQIHYNICSGDTVSLSAYYNTNYKYEWGPDIAFRSGGINEGPVVSARIDQAMFVHLTVYDDYGCANKDSIYVRAQPCCNVWLPTAFTPNNDGRNDIYRLVGDGHIELTTFAIRNRFGQVVFETANQYEAWDGKFNGQLCDVGTYFYYLRYKCGDKYVEKKGDVTLIR